MEDLHGKAHLVVGDHVASKQDVITYSSLVTREMVLIALTMAALYYLEVKCDDIQQRKDTDSIWFRVLRLAGKSAITSEQNTD